MGHRRPHPTFASSVFSEPEGARPVQTQSHTANNVNNVNHSTRPYSATYTSSVFSQSKHSDITITDSDHGSKSGVTHDSQFSSGHGRPGAYPSYYHSSNINPISGVGGNTNSITNSNTSGSHDLLLNQNHGRKCLHGPDDKISRNWTTVQDEDFIPTHKKRIMQPGVNSADVLDESGRPKLLASDCQGAICHQRKRFPEKQYVSNISTLSADNAAAIEQRTARHLTSSGVACSLQMSDQQVPDSAVHQPDPNNPTSYRSEIHRLPSQSETNNIDTNITFSMDPQKSIYPNASSVHHSTRRTIPHGQTPYANSEEFRMLKRENKMYEEGILLPCDNSSDSNQNLCYNSTNSNSNQNVIGPSPNNFNGPNRSNHNPNRSTFLDHDNTIRDPYQDQGYPRNQKKMVEHNNGSYGNNITDGDNRDNHLLAYGNGICPSKVPRKHVPHYEHERAGRNSYSRQFMNRYEATDDSGVNDRVGPARGGPARGANQNISHGN